VEPLLALQGQSQVRGRAGDPVGKVCKNCRFHPQEGHWPCGANGGRQTGLGYSDRYVCEGAVDRGGRE